MLSLFSTADMLKEIFDHIPVFTEQGKCCAGSKSELIKKTSKSCDLSFANSGRAPRNLELFEAAE